MTSKTSKFSNWSMPKYISEEWLIKKGWRGKGLGKDEQGMKDYIRVAKKTDKSGVGQTSYLIKDFNWWDNLYTSAAQKLKVDGKSKEISSEKKEVKETLLYGRFVKAKETTNFEESNLLDKEKKDEITISSKSKKRKKINEDDLYNICNKSELRSFRQVGKMSRINNEIETSSTVNKESKQSKKKKDKTKEKKNKKKRKRQS